MKGDWVLHFLEASLRLVPDANSSSGPDVAFTQVVGKILVVEPSMRRIGAWDSAAASACGWSGLQHPACIANQEPEYEFRATSTCSLIFLPQQDVFTLAE